MGRRVPGDVRRDARPTGGTVSSVATFTVTAGLSFNGTSNTLVVADSATLRTSTSAFTVCFWLYRAMAGLQVLCRKWDYTGTTGGMFLDQYSNSGDDFFVVNALGDGGSSFGRWNVSNLPLNTWVHVAKVFDGTLSGNANRLKGYYGGAQVTADSFTGTIPAAAVWSGTSHPLRVAHASGPGTFANGRFADVRFYTRALTAAEVLNIKNGTQVLSGLAMWHRFLEGSGTTANDSSGNTNTGTHNATYVAYP